MEVIVKWVMLVTLLGFILVMILFLIAILHEKFTTPPLFGNIVPIVRVLKYKTGMKETDIKRQIVQDISLQLMPYIQFDIQEQNNGTILIQARLDVLNREETNNGKKEE